VVEAPGLGDDVQAIKAGLLEIADILVVNKADRPGVENTERALKNMLQLAHPVKRVFRHHGQAMTVEAEGEEEALWIPPVLRTVATEGSGVPELLEAIARHRAHIDETGDLERRVRARLESELELRLQDAVMARWRAAVSERDYEKVVEQLLARELSPSQAAARLLNGKSPK
jgi:LAO/AO transport system kinase